LRASAATSREGGNMTERQVPFYCPYCGEQDLRPSGPDGGGWRCVSCARSFELRFAGLDRGGS
jgi:transposase-like protein